MTNNSIFIVRSNRRRSHEIERKIRLLKWLRRKTLYVDFVRVKAYAAKDLLKRHPDRENNCKSHADDRIHSQWSGLANYLDGSVGLDRCGNGSRDRCGWLRCCCGLYGDRGWKVTEPVISRQASVEGDIGRLSTNTRTIWIVEKGQNDIRITVSIEGEKSIRRGFIVIYNMARAREP